MSFLDKIISIFPIHIDLSQFKGITVQLLSNNTSKKIEKHDNRQINININSLEPLEKEKLEKAIAEAVKKEDYVLLEKKTKRLLDDISQSDEQSASQDLLSFFRGKISTRDLEILRAALIIKNLHDKGENVKQIKQDLVERYGDRGRNMANLCSAGYFESYIQPFYESIVDSPQFSPKSFQSWFDTIVMKYPFAVFVSSVTVRKECVKEIKDKIALNKQYGLKELNIHGIGAENVQKIREIVTELESQHDIEINMTGYTIIHVKVNL